ncbi:MAG: 2-oxoacid:acceptor oxidoreductase subunit alpha, partial [Desulfobia sp.]
MDITIRIGGAAGQGLQSIGSALTALLAREGYHVFSHQNYMSRIRGGHNFYQIRLADRPLAASREKVDILVALDRETIDRHHATLSNHGLVISDQESLKEEFAEKHYLNVPAVRLTKEAGINKIMANSVTIGALLSGLGLGLDSFNEVIRQALSKKGEDIIEDNLEAARLGRDHINNQGGWPRELKAGKSKPGELRILSGNQGIGYGALVSGCRFYSAYPMTPSTGIMIYLAAKAQKHGIVVEQAEDEIAAINMAIGASFGGVRAMTGTSGGGFALMNEGLSLAGITETPLVIAEVQRPGPATGLPTRTEQGDLLFVLHAGHGEFAKVLMAPGHPAQAVELTNRAFELAEKYQIPVIVQSDQYLADSEWTYTELNTDNLQYQDHRLRQENQIPANYKRYALNNSGISPLAVPGKGEGLVVADSDEHDEEGHIIEDAETRTKMVEKRLSSKMVSLKEEIRPPELYGSEKPRVILAGFGSTYGIMREAVDNLAEREEIACLHFAELWP